MIMPSSPWRRFGGECSVSRCGRLPLWRRNPRAPLSQGGIWAGRRPRSGLFPLRDQPDQRLPEPQHHQQQVEARAITRKTATIFPVGAVSLARDLGDANTHPWLQSSGTRGSVRALMSFDAPEFRSDGDSRRRLPKYAPCRVLRLSSAVPPPIVRPLAPTGFTRLSTMATGSWPGATP